MASKPHTTVREGERERICWKCGATFRTSVEVCPNDGSRLIELSSEERSDPLIGTLFDGRFRIIRKLGEGGMGTVYSARQTDFERDVALKILKADFVRDENIRKRFMYEARAISGLAHPHALRIYDFGQAPDDSFYMVMELLKGESLADRLAYRFLTYREIFDIIPPIAGVLGEAHRNDVIHRDLKPENIYIVDVNQNSEFAKLLDFGIAKHLKDTNMTRSGTLWGTPAYMSPEQAKGDLVGAPADVYAVGIMLYELICGNLPFHASTQMGLAMKHISVPARSLLSIPGLASVPQELDDLILKMLQKQPEERPQSMQEVADELISIRDRYFDEALLASVPAEEVDALELQKWIAEEPLVEEDVSLPKMQPYIPTSPPGSPIRPTRTSPGHTMRTGEKVDISVEEDLMSAVDAAQDAIHIFDELEEADISRSMTLNSSDLSSEFRTGGRPLLLWGSLGVAVVSVGVIFAALFFHEPTTIYVDRESPAGDPSVAFSGPAAGEGATNAAAVIVTARTVARDLAPAELIFVDELETTGSAPKTSSRRKVRPRPRPRPTKAEESPVVEEKAAPEVRTAIEKTF